MVRVLVQTVWGGFTVYDRLVADRRPRGRWKATDRRRRSLPRPVPAAKCQEGRRAVKARDARGAQTGHSIPNEHSPANPFALHSMD